MSAAEGPRDVVASGFFALRTALLPLDELAEWSAGLAAPSAAPEALEAAWRHDVERLRERLRALVTRPEIDEALRLASPSLHTALEHWRSAPASAKGRRCEEALVRYLTRLCTRPTPFGLFAGSSLGHVRAGATWLELSPRAAYTRRSRLDCDYVYGLAEALARTPELLRALPLRPNSTLQRSASQWHYVETRQVDGRRSHHLVAVQAAPHVDFTLEHARAGRCLDELGDALWRHLDDPEVAPEDARAFVAGLVDEQALVPELAPPLTVADPLDELARTLERHAAQAPVAARAATRLRAVQTALAELDAGGLGRPAAVYERAARELAELPLVLEPARFVQVDLCKPTARAELGADVLDELRRGAQVLQRLSRPRSSGPLERFRDAFVERYGEDRDVPLLEALDDERGVGFDPGPPTAADPSPLVAGLALDGRPNASTAPFTARDAWLLRRLDALRARGERELGLSAADVDALASPAPLPLPDAFHVMAVLAADSPAALAAGRFRVWLHHAAGPSGARVLGRFCHAEPALTPLVEQHLRAEEALVPDADFAEIVHLPEERLGNVLARPVLRRYEIPYLGRSAAPPERQLAVGELRVRVDAGEIRLFCARTGRRVVPRLTSAHVFDRGLSVYRFLGLLQSQGLAGGVFWSWGALEHATFLPRVTHGRLLLARARWRAERAEIAPLAALADARRFEAVRRWRATRGLPRRAALLEGSDRELLVDFDNALSIDAFLGAARALDELQLVEPFPTPDEQPVCGPEGAYAHELLVPFVRAHTARPVCDEARSVGAGGAVPRAFAPGSEWLYAKLYAGAATVDGLLVETVGPLVKRLRAAGLLEGWFFVRYGDPHWHVRLRLRGRPERLAGEALPALHAALRTALEDGRLWKLQLDTYEREVERYGGPTAIAACERLFEADSDAALELLAAAPPAGPDARWQWTLLGLDAWLVDLGLESEVRRRVVQQARDWSARELAPRKPVRLQIDRRFRIQRATLERLYEAWTAGDGTAHPLAGPARAVFDRRARSAAGALAELRRLAACGELTRPLAALAPSLMHMHVNRLARCAGQVHELLLYDFLARLLVTGAQRRPRACVRA